MSAIKFRQDGHGNLVATAQTNVNGKLKAIGVKKPMGSGKEAHEPADWKELAMELFAERDKVQNGSSKPKLVQ